MTRFVTVEVCMDALAALQAEVQFLREQLAQKDRVIEQQQQIIRDLQKRLEEAERAAKRQAAPFSKGEPKKKPKKPGRKKGEQHGVHGHREPPQPTQVDETLDAPLPEQCPDCGGDVVEDPERLDQQFQTEIPRQPIVREFKIHCGYCQKCGKHLRGRHPLQTSDATGAAQSQLGPDAQAAVVDLNKRAGMSYGKIVGTFAKFFGIPISRGACAQIVLRAGQKLQPVYEQIKEHLKSAEHITPDETGWRIGGHPVWLHGWVAGDGTTCYAIDPQRGADVLAKVIGWDWSGTMTHDGCPSYDRFVDAGHQQCVDHATRRARALVDKQNGSAKVFPNQVIDLFGKALDTRDQFRAGQLDQAEVLQAYEQYVSALLDLTARPRTNELNETFAKHLYHHGEQWFTFLLDPTTTPATNHRAEQALKTPIVNRKVWGGNRTDAGGEAQAVTSSVLQTCKNKTIDAFTFVSNAFCGVLGNLFT
jgi:transposase